MRYLPWLVLLAALGCGSPPAMQQGSPLPKQRPADAGSQGTGQDGGSLGGPPDGGNPAGSHLEDFESVQLGQPSWQVDPVPQDGPFADDGLYWRQLGAVPPQAYRLSQPFGEDGWLTLESYSRSSTTPLSSLVSVVTDPANPSNHVLRIGSPAHTDATVVRPTHPLPPHYRVSLRVGFVNFGDGLPGLNGYKGGETAEPWSNDDSTQQNGVYWLTILDFPPRPHNNTWIHHHRKVVIDVDNNYPAWTQVFNGQTWVLNGEHPVTMFALDGKGQGYERTGKPFIAYSGGSWQPSGEVRSVDSYLPNEWYSVSIERNGTVFTLTISGRFKYAGQTTYSASIDAKDRCIWHFNRNVDEDASACIDNGYYPSLNASFPNWPAGTTWPDYFMFGDPHNNYYEGSVLYDDVRLEVLP